MSWQKMCNFLNCCKKSQTNVERAEPPAPNSVVHIQVTQPVTVVATVAPVRARHQHGSSMVDLIEALNTPFDAFPTAETPTMSVP